MSGESPGRTVIKTCGSKCACELIAELFIDRVDLAVDVLSNFDQCVKILDIVRGRNDCAVHCAVVFYDRLVVDDAVALIAVSYRCDLAVIFDAERLVGKMLIDRGILEIICVIVPCLCGRCVAYVKDCRSFALSHLGLELCCVCSCSCCLDFYRNACLLCVGLGDCCPCVSRFRLLVQDIYTSAAGICCCRRCCRAGISCCRSSCSLR